MSNSDSDNETSSNIKAGNQMPVILPIASMHTNEDEPKEPKTRKKRTYKITEKVRQRNIAASKMAAKKRDEERAKLKEYEMLKAVKTISKEDAEEIFNSKLSAIEERLKKLTEPKEEVKQKEPEVLPIIKEEPEDTAYLSASSTDSQKRSSSRFVKRDISPNVSRLSERFKRF